MLIDTHCHIHDHEYPLDPDKVLAEASQNDVRQVIVIGTCPSDAHRAQAFAATHPNVFWSYGYHPDEATENFEFFSDDNLVSIGEIGLDYHYKPYDRVAQIQRFEMMLDLAVKQDLPINFHIREAFSDFWPILNNFPIKNAVLHSFSDDATNLRKALDAGFYIGVNGLATFANLPLAPLESIILETDAPFLAPKPFRGQPNQPAYILQIATWLAQRLGVSLDTVATQTSANAQKLFRLPPPV